MPTISVAGAPSASSADEAVDPADLDASLAAADARLDAQEVDEAIEILELAYTHAIAAGRDSWTLTNLLIKTSEAYQAKYEQDGDIEDMRHAYDLLASAELTEGSGLTSEQRDELERRKDALSDYATVPSPTEDSESDVEPPLPTFSTVLNFDAAGPHSASFGLTITESLERHFAEHGLESVGNAASGIQVELVVKRMGGGQDNYRIGIMFHRADGLEFPLISDIECISCTKANLIRVLDAFAPEFIRALIESLRSNAPPKDMLAKFMAAASEQPRSTVMTGAGAGLLLLGTGTIGLGVVEALHPRVYDASSRDALELRYTKHWPIGATLLATGGLAVITGSILVAVDQRRLKRSPNWLRVVEPIITRTEFGVGMVGQF